MARHANIKNISRNTNNVDKQHNLCCLSNMNTISDIIETLGGNAALAADLKTGASTVSEMKRRGSIPVKHWPALLQRAQGMGVELTEKQLMDAHVIEVGQ